MRSRYELKLTIGILIWLGLLCAGVLSTRSALKEKSGAPFGVARFLSTPIQKVELHFTPDEVFRVGTPIFMERGGANVPVGRIVRVNELNSVDTEYVYSDRAFAEIFASAPEIGAGAYLTFHTTPDSFAWVIEIMLGPKTRGQIGNLILEAYADHQQEIVAAFRPILEDSLRESSEIIREDLRRAIANHESELNQLGEKFQTDLIETEIIPLVQNEIWPVVQYESQPLLTQIGLEIWEEVSLWRFTWKYLYDSSPLPERNLALKEFRRFVDNKAAPIIESHLGDLIEVQQRILSRVSQNQKVKETVSRSIRNIMRDKQVQQLVTDIFHEVFVDNPRLQKVLEDNWNSPRAQAALAMTNSRLESTITEIGQILFGSPDGSITPEFSRVLRSRILHKDDRWMVLHVGDAGREEASHEKVAAGSDLPVLRVVSGETSTENPFHIPAVLGSEN